MTALLAPAYADAPSADDIDDFLDTLGVADLAIASASSLDEVVGDWNRFSRFDHAIEAATYRRDDGFGVLTVGLVLHVETGMPTLATARVSVGRVGERLVLLAAEYAGEYDDEAPDLD